jgi:holo-ACP synthase CitX
MDFAIGKVILRAREERYERKRRVNAKDVLIEIASIVPGYPKHQDGLKRIFVDGLTELAERLEGRVAVMMEDAGGYYAVVQSPRRGTACKQVAIAIEEQWPWNRLLDIDVYDAGLVLTRLSLQAPERKCLICDDIHSRCIYERRHSLDEVRRSALALISLYLNMRLERSRHE